MAPLPQSSAALPLPFVPGSVSVAVLPDTQEYSERWPHHFRTQAAWIAAHAKERDIRLAIHLGDVTQRNTPEQWARAREALRPLDGVVPLLLTTGNHDSGDQGRSGDRTTLLNDWFLAGEQRRWPGFGGTMEPDHLENAYHLFEAHGRGFLALVLEWSPRDEAVAWASDVLASNEDRLAILATHAWLYDDGTRYDVVRKGEDQLWSPASYGTARLGPFNDGEQLFQKLARRHGNVVMALCGHVLGAGAACLTSPGNEGQFVHQMLSNYQMRPEGGEGYMRLIELLPDGETAQVRTFSPSLERHLTDPLHQFTLKLQPGARTR